MASNPSVVNVSSDKEDRRLAQDEVPEPGAVPESSNDSNIDGTPEERLLLVQRRLIVATLSVCLFFGILYLASIFADILRIFGISILISYLFINVVDWLTRYIKNRAVSIFIVYAVCGVIVTIAFLTVVPSLVYQINLLLASTVKQVPELFERFCHALIPIDERLASAKIQLRAIDMLSRFAQSLPSMDSAHVIGRMSEVAMSTMTWVLYGLSIMVLSFYFLLDGHRMRDQVIAALPARTHARLTDMAADIDTILQSFFRGQIVMGFAFGLVMMGVYFLLGVQYALVLGLALAIWEIVPVIGPLMGFIPAFVVVLLNGMDNVPVDRIWHLVIIVLIFNIGQWIKDNMVAPRYIGNAVGLHPVIIFVSIMIGARLDGMLGIIFAIPAASVVNVVYQHLWASKSSRQLAEQGPTVI